MGGYLVLESDGWLFDWLSDFEVRWVVILTFVRAAAAAVLAVLAVHSSTHQSCCSLWWSEWSDLLKRDLSASLPYLQWVLGTAAAFSTSSMQFVFCD